MGRVQLETWKISRRRFLMQMGIATAMMALVPEYIVRAAQARPGPSVDLMPVDALKVTCLVDFGSDSTLKGTGASDLSISRPGDPKASVARGEGSTHLLSEYGLAFVIESKKGSATYTILHDFGLSSQVLLNNMNFMKIDPSVIDALVLSHGHIDHYGGLPGFLATYKDRLTRRPRLYVGHQDAFAARWKVRKKENKVYQGRLDRKDVANYSTIVLAKAPLVLGGHACLSGTIPMVSGHERPSSSSKMERQGGLAGDSFEDEIAIYYRLRNKGLVVITACGHRGLVNTVAHAKAITGIDRVHAVVGGMHLATAPLVVVDETVGRLARWQVKHLVPMHCTGIAATGNLRRRLSNQTHANASGTVFTWT